MFLACSYQLFLKQLSALRGFLGWLPHDFPTWKENSLGIQGVRKWKTSMILEARVPPDVLLVFSTSSLFFHSVLLGGDSLPWLQVTITWGACF